MNALRCTLFAACLALAAGCGSDDGTAPPRHTLSPGEAFHGTMTPAGPVAASDAGQVAITAVADPGFVFAGWVATPADKAVFADAGLAATNVTLSGSATVSPTFMVAAADFFVNQRLGSDGATGTTAAQPFRTLTQALVAAGAAGKAAGSVLAVAPGTYDAANGEVFPIIVPPYVTLVGDEENHGAGTVILGAGPPPGSPTLATALIPSSYATLAGLYVQSWGRSTVRYDGPSGGTGITVRRCTIVNTTNTGSELLVALASGGAIEDNVFPAGSQVTLGATGGAGNTRVQGNVFHGPVAVDDNYLDLGGGAGASTGHNQFLGTRMSWFGGAGTMARNNHWRHVPPTFAPSWDTSPSDYDIYLAFNATIDVEGSY